MKISIDHGEQKRGIFRKVTHYTVKMTVELSEEEKKIVQERDLREVIILNWQGNSLLDENPNLDDHIKFRTLVYGSDMKGFRILSDAKVYEARLIEALKQAKAYLDANESVRETSKSFEL